MAKYKAYPEYKDSGVEWLGALPKYWDICRLKNLATIKNGQDYKSVQVEYGYPVIGSGGQFTFASKYMYDKPSVLLGRKGTIDKPLYINKPFWTVDTMYYTELNKGVDAKYLYYLALTIQFSRYSTNTALPSMTQEHLSNYKFAVPKIESDRKQITEFLDHETAKIDNLIEKQQQLIELLKEKRQAVISHAVTKGLNPDVPMKDSGVEWLGKVPEHWEVCLLKLKCDAITDGAHISPETNGGLYYFVSIKDIKKGVIDFDNALLTTVKSYEYLIRTGCMPLSGDILFSKDGTIGQTAIAPSSIEFVVASSLIIIRPNKTKVLSEFLNFLLQSSLVKEQVESFVKGAALRRLSIQNLQKVFGIFPPLNEQIKISNYINKKLASFDILETQAAVQINLLQERRTALISAAVTGKIDVRDWVAPDAQQTESSQETTK